MSNHPDAVPIRHSRISLFRYFPILNWLPLYNRENLVGDLMAGLIVAIMLVPQGMAYALLAGLPPQVGLYSSIVPLIIYGILGTSRVLAVGPVAIVSLLVASGVTPLAETGSADYVQLALTLALLVGIIQTVMGLVRIGFIVNFLSHPVLTGFTSAAAIVIGFSQLKHILGIGLPGTDYFYETVQAILERLTETNGVTLSIGLGSIGILLYFKMGLGRQLKRWGMKDSAAVPLTKSAPLVVVLLGALLVWGFSLNERVGVSIVGDVPAGLPPISLPTMDLGVWQMLLPTAFAISFVGYMESISVAKSLASKRRQKIDANQELIALGVANLGATLTGGYPVTGGISRSVVNFAAGAQTGLASMITALLMALSVIFLVPLFYFLPKAVLAAIIIVAVAGMVDVKGFQHVWRYNKLDAASFAATFLAVLIIGVENGILVGAAAAMLLFIWRTSQPHIAVVGRLGDSEIYRNVLRHDVTTCPKVAAVRVDGSLYFANCKSLEDAVLGIVADQPDVEHFVLIGTAVNAIDASALKTLESLHAELHDAGVTLHLSAIKGPVLDRLQLIGFVDHIGEAHIHECTHDAMKAIGCVVPKAANRQ
jgi:SulP family sulfate permease